MSTVVKTCEEFSTRRKIRYGAGSSSTTTTGSEVLKSTPYTLRPSSINASLSPHKSYYGRDQDDVPAYFIEFNIGDFQFDEITIRTEDHNRLVVQGKSKCDEDSDELCREFTRDFTLPNNVDQYSIKAQLEETTRQLTLIGQLTESVINNLSNTAEKELKGGSLAETSASLTAAMATTSISSSSNTTSVSNERRNTFSSASKLGSVVETRLSSGIEYEIYLGNELRDGQVNLEMVNYNTLIVRVIKSDWDKNGDFSLELKRQIKLPYGSNPQNTEHGVLPSGTLLIKVPFK